MNKLFIFGNYYRNLSAISKICSPRNVNVLSTRNELRLVSNDAKSKPAIQETNSTQAEWDKPQWERSDRYVSFLEKMF